MTAASPRRCPPNRDDRASGRDTRTAILYLAPAFLVMGLITFYPLIYQTYMSFTDFRLRNLRARRRRAAVRRASTTTSTILESNSAIPNFHFLRLILFNLWWAFSNVVIHVILGVGDRRPAQHQGPAASSASSGRSTSCPVVIPPIIVATVWRNMFDTDVRRDQPGSWPSSGGSFTIPPETFQIDWLRQIEDPIPFIPLPLAYFALLTANTWLGWPLNSVVATAPCRASRASCTRPPRWTARRLAEVPDRDADLPAAGDAARTRSTAS